MSLVLLILALVVLSYVLSRATDVLIGGIVQLSRGTAFEAYGLTTFLVALATSLPELFVGVTAALEGRPSLPLGVLMGSNIANVSLVVGGAAVISGAIRAKKQVYKKDIAYAFLAGILPMVLISDGVLSRIDGLVLVAIYVWFVIATMSKKKRERLEKEGDEFGGELDLTHRVLALVGKQDVEMGLLRLTVGSAMLVVCADWIVRLAQIIAEMAQIPVLIVGLFMVSVGTVMPELSFEIKAAGKREYMMVFGNLIGSIVANSSLILGLVALISPVLIDGNKMTYFGSAAFFVFIFGLFWWFTCSKKELTRLEGAILVGCYLAFALVQIGLA